MNLLPYKRITIETKRSFDSIKTILDKNCAPPKTFDIHAILKSALEYQVTTDAFRIILGGYGFFYGSANFNPVLTGKFTANPGKNSVDCRIGLQRNGIILLLLILAVTILALTVSIKRNQWEGIITAALLIIVTCWGVMARFNKVSKKYMSLISQFADR